MTEAPQEVVTQALRALELGDRSAIDRLLPLIYQDLRGLAQSLLRADNPNQTIQATALVHEAYLRLVHTQNPGWSGRKHFFDVAALAMRQLLCNQARRRGTEKRGGRLQRVELDQEVAGLEGQDREVDVLALDEALDHLTKVHPRQARMVSLKYFAGLTDAEIGEMLEVSERTVRIDCRMARGWLHRALDRES
jgi:RNA polymerase sigma factor (TIGR02999 family)